MAATYKKLWYICIDWNLNKKDIEKMVKIFYYQMCKFTTNINVTTDVIYVFFLCLNIKLNGIWEFVANLMNGEKIANE
ncbi:MAG: hypothetical protein BWX78_01123 [Firmicutes bacterium ADurb.Bin099]|nr:MAG: hypothetical protein BWX78_01123 [Firmicutes bacterium ADurb.Bin099]